MKTKTTEKRKMKSEKRKTRKLLILFSLFSLLFFSCPETNVKIVDSGFPPGMGSFSLGIGDARTILPDTMSFGTFAVYGVVFYNAGTATIHQSGNITSASNEIFLLPGNYDVEVTAYKDFTGGVKTKPGAFGKKEHSVADPITITAGVNSPVTVLLSAYPIGDPTATEKGAFSWTISFDSSLTLTTQTMEITPHTGGTGETITLSGANLNSSRELDPGYYQVKITLIKSTDTHPLIWLESLHIYQNLTSTYTPAQFTDASFNIRRYVVTLNHNDKDNTVMYQSVNHGQGITGTNLPTLTTADKPGYIFDGWLIGGTTYTGGAITADTTLNAKWVQIAVTSITGVPTTATAGSPLTLTGTINPAEALANILGTPIVWTVSDDDDGSTGAAITVSGGVYTLNTSTQGTATVTATIANGINDTTDYTEDFDITVAPTSVGVTLTFNQITGLTPTFSTGVTLYRVGTTGRSATISVSNADSFNTINWYFEGDQIYTGTTITLTTDDTAASPAILLPDLTMGVRELTVIATTTAGVPYSARVTFNVALEP